MSGLRAEYEAPKFGAIIEVLGTVGTLKVLTGTGAAGSLMGQQPAQGSVSSATPATTWDPITDARFQTLHPRVQNAAADFINDVEKQLGRTLRVTQAFSSFSWVRPCFGRPFASYRASYCLVLSGFDGLSVPAEI